MHHWLFWIILAYLSGSIPFGLLIARAKGIDIRRTGSGNIGATNVGRTLGKKYGILCFLLDTLKGALPVTLAGYSINTLNHWQLPPSLAWTWLSIAAAAILGHIFPLWLKFRGGKGVATALGATLGFYPLLTLPALASAFIWLLFASTFRYVSLASITAAISLPLCVLWQTALLNQHTSSAYPFLLTTSALALLVILRHLSNIKRLLQGTESQLGTKTKSTPSTTSTLTPSPLPTPQPRPSSTSTP